MKPGLMMKMVLLSLVAAAGAFFVYEAAANDDESGKRTSRKTVKAKKAKKAKKKKTRQKAKEAEESKAETPSLLALYDKPVAELSSLTGRKPVKLGKVPMVLKNQGSIAGEDWADCAKVKARVEKEILARLGEGDEAAVSKFVESAENRLLLAQWVVADAELRAAREAGAAQSKRTEALTRTHKEVVEMQEKWKATKDPGDAMVWNATKLAERFHTQVGAVQSEYTLADSVSGAAAKLMEQLGGDEEWLSQFAFSGECVRPGMAFAILKKIYVQHPDMLENRIVRDIATATALEYAKSDWDQQDAVERANFYIEAWKDQRLNVVFDTLPMWQRRMVCGCKGNNDIGSVESLEWLLDHFNLPADRYSGACWRSAYRLHNLYGESIHGPLYYAPFDSSLGKNQAAKTYHVGGVCGSLSHFGAFAALANGVPAMTAGEPGHCAYIVLVGDKWTPAYSLSWERGLHWQVFNSVHTYSSLHAASELYSKGHEKLTLKSNALRVLGGVYAAEGKVRKAAACYEDAAKLQPRNYMAMREWREALEGAKGDTAELWTRLNDLLCEKLVPIYPELASEHLHKGLAKGLADHLSPKELEKAYLKFWKKVDTMGPDRWRIEDLANKQVSLLGCDKDTKKLCGFYSDILGATVSKSAYAPAMLSWGNGLSAKLDQKGKSQMMQAMLDGIGKGGKMDMNERINLLKPTILAAEANRDMKSFQAIATMVKEAGYKNAEIRMPKVEPFPGKLASKDGLVWTSSTSQWDKPHDHAGILTPEGGSFHTGKDKDAFVAVELPRQVKVTGVALVMVDGNFHRCHNLKIQVSENGKDWTDVHAFGPCQQRVMRADLGDKQPVAKYVRILRPGGPEFFHLNGIYVYGHQAA